MRIVFSTDETFLFFLRAATNTLPAITISANFARSFTSFLDLTPNPTAAVSPQRSWYSVCMTKALQNIAVTVAPVMKRYGIKRAKVYGSFARGEERDDSDVDLLVTLGDKKLSIWDFVGLRDELEEQLDRPVDVVTDTSVLPQLKPYIERDATLVYEER